MKTRSALVVALSTVILSASLAVSAPSAGAAPVISPSTLATAPAYIGQPYVASLSYTVGATWSVVSGELPPGLTFNGGQIAGVPNQGGAYTFVVQANGIGSSAKKAYTILVNMPTSTGYDARMHSVLVGRDASPSPSACNHTGYLTYAIADLWLNRDPTDVNNKIASLQFSHIGGDPSACSAHSNQRRNNLMLGLLVRPYMLYNPSSS
jgi:hypothetical protein